MSTPVRLASTRHEHLRSCSSKRVRSALQAMILEANPAWYAGLWVESKAGFEVLVYSTDPDAPGLSTMTASVDGLDGRVRALPVEASLRQLVAEQQLILDAWRGEALPFTLDIDVRGNRVEVGTTGPKWASQDRLAMLPPHARLSGVHQQLITSANLYGGLWLSSCTAGFGVKNSAGTKGISTAGHCSNTQSFGGANLPYVTGKFSGAHDSQWHTRAGHTILDDVRYGTSGTRDVSGRAFRSVQALGTNVCYYGGVEGWDCATLESNNHTCAGSSPTSTCMRLGAPQDLVDDGDSGGPVYKPTSTAVTAYGLISACLTVFWEDDCSGTNDLIYVATDYVEAPLGALIMTSP